MDREELTQFAETATRFARRDVDPMIGTEGRDGDLDRLGGVLDAAESAGLTATADVAGAGHEFGVWGTATDAEGPAFSLVVLEQIATACAGVAACLHAGGLGAAELAGTSLAPRRTAAAFFEHQWRFDATVIQRPPDDSTVLTFRDGTLYLSGLKTFVCAPPGCDGFVVYASGESGWERVYVPRNTQGLVCEEIGHRTGLAAVDLFHLSFYDVAIPPEHRLVPASPARHVAHLLVGLAAIAVGNARAAVQAARDYAAERYQGGTTIDRHDAVRILIGDSASRVAACAAYLGSLASGKDPLSLVDCVAAKLRITADTCRAVTDSLQVLGGYGYMEDYRLEKRLRDAMTLRTMTIRPNDLRMLVADLGAEDDR